MAADTLDLLLDGVLDGDAAVAVAEIPASKPTVAAATSAPTTRRGKQPIYVDIETIPDESRLELFGLEPLPTVGPRTPAADMLAVDQFRTAGLDALKLLLQTKRPDDDYLAQLEAAEKVDKKPRKGLFDLIDELRGEAESITVAAEAQRKKMSCTPEMNRIVALGWAVGSDVVSSLVVGMKSADGRGVVTELDLLDKFWSLAAVNTGPIVGYNVLGFDLPTLFVRSMLLGVKSPRKLDMKPWGADVIDLMQARFPKSAASKLKDIARMMGIPVPAEGVDGSQVAPLYAAGEFVKISEYVRSDVQISRALREKYSGFFCA